MRRLFAATHIFLVLSAFPAVTVNAEQVDDATKANGNYAEESRLANQGDAKAQTFLGEMYEFGKGMPQDYAEAVKWFRKAADQGNAKGQNDLGVMYEWGWGVPQDYTEAEMWYRKAADQGEPRAQYNLGMMYGIGHGNGQGAENQGDFAGQSVRTDRDDAEAVRWYRMAADQGDAAGQFALGVVYEMGMGVPQDYTEAAKWYRKSADQGNAEGQKHLDALLAQGQGRQAGRQAGPIQQNQPVSDTIQTLLDAIPDSPKSGKVDVNQPASKDFQSLVGATSIRTPVTPTVNHSSDSSLVDPDFKAALDSTSFGTVSTNMPTPSIVGPTLFTFIIIISAVYFLFPRVRHLLRVPYINKSDKPGLAMAPETIKLNFLLPDSAPH